MVDVKTRDIVLELESVMAPLVALPDVTWDFFTRPTEANGQRLIGAQTDARIALPLIEQALSELRRERKEMQADAARLTEVMAGQHAYAVKLAADNSRMCREREEMQAVLAEALGHIDEVIWPRLVARIDAVLSPAPVETSMPKQDFRLLLEEASYFVWTAGGSPLTDADRARAEVLGEQIRSALGYNPEAQAINRTPEQIGAKCVAFAEGRAAGIKEASQNASVYISRWDDGSQLALAICIAVEEHMKPMPPYKDEIGELLNELCGDERDPPSR